MKPDFPEPIVVVFAKWPEAGRVKTRLTPEITPTLAAEIHDWMLDTVIRRVSAWSPRRQVLAVSPDDRRHDAEQRWPHLNACLGQGQGDLGSRIVRITRQLHERWSGPLVILGNDSPDLPMRTCAAALHAVASGRSALCPSRDGGYCLIATPVPQPALFQGIEWGTPRVADQTRAAAARAGIELVELEPWEDVDTMNDLRRLVARLPGSTDPHLLELHHRLLSAKLPVDGRQRVQRDGEAARRERDGS